MPDVISANEKLKYPMQKPVAVLQSFILASTDENEIIFDPFMGTGSTLLAAKSIKRKAIGIEIEERYCEIAAERLRQQTLMFSEAI